MTAATKFNLTSPQVAAARLRVAYVIDVLDTDLAGTENQLLKMIRGFGEERFEVHLICLRPHRWLADNAASLPCTIKVIEIARLSRPKTYVNALALAAYFRAVKPDVVHTFFPVSNIVGVLAARLAGIKCIVSSRRDYGEWMRRRYLYATRFANRFVSLITTNSSPVARLTVEREHITDAKVRTFHNGIEVARFRALTPDHALKAQLNIPSQVKVVGIVANFRPMKHHRTFLLAAAEIARQRRDAHFVLVGGGPLRDAMTAFAGELGIGAVTHFVGSKPDVSTYLSIFDVGVNCSEMEGLSNAIMEYMAAGVPCVVAESGGNVDLIRHGETGYTFALDDHASLASLVTALLDDSVERRRLIENARKKIEREMSTETMLDNYAGLYHSLAGR